MKYFEARMSALGRYETSIIRRKRPLERPLLTARRTAQIEAALVSIELVDPFYRDAIVPSSSISACFVGAPSGIWYFPG
jgi:hypothetical protein